MLYMHFKKIIQENKRKGEEEKRNLTAVVSKI